MAFRRLQGLRLSPELKERLQRQKIESTQDLAHRSDVELSETLNVSVDEADQLLTSVAEQITETPRTAYELLESASSLPVLSLCPSHPPLSLHPGLTELVGPSGVGKTQCCLTLTVESYVLSNALLPPTSLPPSSLPLCHILYLDTEGSFSPPRLVEVARARFPHVFTTPASITSLLSNVLVYSTPTPTSLLSTLLTLETPILTHRVSLLVVDSIASPVRAEYGRGQIAERQAFLSKVAGILKELSERFNVVCVVTNQVMARFGGRGGPGDEDGGGGTGGDLQAALGVSWAHAVNTRWVVEDEEGGGGRRRLRVAKTPMYRGCIYRYVVTDAGVVVGEEVESTGEDEEWNVMGMRIRRELEVGEGQEGEATLEDRMQINEDGELVPADTAQHSGAFYEEEEAVQG